MQLLYTSSFSLQQQGKRMTSIFCNATSPTQPNPARQPGNGKRRENLSMRRLEQKAIVNPRAVGLLDHIPAHRGQRMTLKQTKGGQLGLFPQQQRTQEAEEAAPPAPTMPTWRMPRPELTRSELGQRVQALLLAGGESEMPIANTRAVAALPFAGNLRLIDIPIHNMAQSGINKMYVLSQFNSHTLFAHLTASYPSIFGGPRNESFVEPLACTQTTTSSNWYRGAAEAVARNIGAIMERGGDMVEDFIIASGTAMYQLDMLDVLRTHRARNADITVVTRSVSQEEAKRLGVVVVQPKTGLVQAFVEKPEDHILEELSHGSRHTSSAQPYEANQGVYVFRKETLLDLLADTDEQTAHVQFGRDVLPAALSWGLTIAVHHNDSPWHEISSLRDFHQANLQLLVAGGPVELNDVYSNPLRSQELLPPSRILGADISSCLVGEGTIIREAKLRSCVLGTNSFVACGADLEGVILLGNSQYQSCSFRDAERAAGRVVQGIGEHSVIRHAIIDSDVSIGPNCRIVNAEGVQEADRSAEGFVVQDGLVVVMRNASIPEGTVI